MGAWRIGGTAVLHTWDQKLRFHPHLHVVVPNAGFDVESGEWKTGSSTFFAPVKVLASFFRRRFLEELALAHGRGELEFHGTLAHLANPGEFHATLAAARSRDWVVYAKRPFRRPGQVFRYLARYTHRIAISDSRITGLRRRDPLLPAPKAQGARAEQAPLRHNDRQRRRVHPPLPAPCPADGMHRIPHFGILANGCRARTLERAREALGPIGPPDDECVDDDAPEGERERDQIADPGTAPLACPHCGAALRLVREIPRRRPAHASRAPPNQRRHHGAQQP